MKYIYSNSRFVREDNDLDVQSALTYFIDTPLLQFTNEAQARIGTIDLLHSQEYLMPIQLQNIILNDLFLFKEHVNFIPYASYLTNFIRANLYILIGDMHYIPKYYWKNLELKYIRSENLDFFLNTFIPFLNWGLKNYQNNVDLILLFSILLLKRDILEQEKSFKHSWPYLSNMFLNNITITNKHESETRVGREDHEYKNTHIIFEPKLAEEYYYLKLIAKEYAVNNFTPKIQIKEANGIVDISYYSYFDNGISCKSSCDFSFTKSYAEKDILIKNHNELYNYFFRKFESLYEEFIKYHNRLIKNVD